MTFPILVEPVNGQYVASLVGAPDMRAIEATRSQAISALEARIQQRIENGELLTLEIYSSGVSRFAGKYKNDPTLRDICRDAYTMRNAERDGL
jgi:hypothetical protein